MCGFIHYHDKNIGGVYQSPDGSKILVNNNAKVEQSWGYVAFLYPILCFISTLYCYKVGVAVNPVRL